ncbi:small GTP-binding protein domain protein [Vittaforma corneae ATCC 50505]|uniref:Eukaryotic translation initiation factor 2 subunit gamma n=1 Tax=Vittaforma corneae (strain ATCC 50505) TaxID=993615 RepID=L2GN49_VITCO|nr:small GTP-binding protein domain protein [Vittaforma corneae ATCC 50505]ELA41732.1 small GTP-binding protein domain protein [Vittaforma corneae ATCC 50505]
MCEEECKIVEKQATINIGTIGHVAHGKTTIVQCISGISTIKYKAELERNITIKLGYANAKIYECECPRPQKYSSVAGKCGTCSTQRKLVRHVSFVDCPGHDVLMATMLTGTAIMDAALLLVAANEPCPQSQTTEHLFAVEVMNLKKIVVIQNKIDLVTKEQAIEQYGQIKEFLKTSQVEGPIVPVSGQLNINIDAVLDYIVNYIEVPKRDRNEKAKMIIIRSFDVNKPGTKIEDLNGGVIGGSLVSGMLGIGDEIEIRPGHYYKDGDEFVCKPFVTNITSLKAEKTALDKAYPGGLIGVGTNLDPSFCKSDRIVGMVMGLKGTLPPVYSVITVRCTLFQKTVSGSKENLKVDESILLNIGSTTTGCKLIELQDESVAVFDLLKPCCCEHGEKIAISRKIKNNWRLIGYGTICEGKEVRPRYD